MEGYNVLRGTLPVLKGKDASDSDIFFCANYIKYLPARGGIYGIEFSGHGNTDASDSSSTIGKNPASGFKFYVFCSENAYLGYVLHDLIDKSKSVVRTLDDEEVHSSMLYSKKKSCFNNKISKPELNYTSNPATFVSSAGVYDPDGTYGITGEGTVTDTIVYPANIGFQGVSYNHEPRPYSNLDGFIDSNNVQYPLYIVVEFAKDPGISTLDYQFITQS